MPATVADLMSYPVHVVTPETDFKAVAAQLRRHDVSALPVVDAHRKVVGMVSEADLLLKVEAGPQGEPATSPPPPRRLRVKAAALTARQVMSKPAVTVRWDATAAHAAGLMRERRVKRLPVVDGSGNLVGIVTRGDLLRVYERDDDGIRREIVEAVARTWPEGTGATIAVRGSKVTVAGTVDRRSEVAALTRLAASVAGVVAVENRARYRNDDLAHGLSAPVPGTGGRVTGRSRRGAAGA